MVVSFVVPSSPDGPTSGLSPQPIRVTANDLVRLEKWSLQFRELLQDRYQPRPIPLPPVTDEDIDADSIKYLLKNLGLPDPRTGTGRAAQKIKVDQLCRRCNALWYYGCDPATFGGLWERLDRPWESVKGVDWHEYCWRRPPPKFSERETLQYANIAWILEKNDVFTQAIQSAVWDSTEDRLNTAVTALRDIKMWRYKYLQRVLELMVNHVAALMSSKTTSDVGNKIRQKIRDSDKLGIQLPTSLGSLEQDEVGLIKIWDQCKDKVSRFSVYGFAYQVDLVLLKDTSDSSVLPPSGTLSQPDNDAASTHGPKRVTTIKVRKLMRRVLGDPYKEEVKKMLGRIDAQIRGDQVALTNTLIAERDRILQGWRGQLQQPQQMLTQRFHQPSDVIAELA